MRLWLLPQNFPEHMAERNAAALLAALQAIPDDPESHDQVVELGDGRVRVERSPEPGVKLRLTPVDCSGESEMWVLRTFDPADSPSDSYPHQLPFLAGIPVMIWEPGPPRIMTAFWGDAPEPQTLLASLVRVSLEQGWNGAPAGEESLAPQFIGLSRGRARRVIAFLSAQGQSMLTVSDSLAD